jgi:hypothetical protein
MSISKEAMDKIKNAFPTNQEPPQYGVGGSADNIVEPKDSSSCVGCKVLEPTAVYYFVCTKCNYAFREGPEGSGCSDKPDANPTKPCSGKRTKLQLHGEGNSRYFDYNGQRLVPQPNLPSSSAT